jgi:para-aminobenzoate synthetase / 4-amino-4-deoxychorismate lyase
MEKGYPIFLHDASTNKWLHFEHPLRIITTTKLDEVQPSLRMVENEVDQNGLHAAGFISYEASPAFDSALTVRKSDNFPLLWFGLYGEPEKSASLPIRENINYQLQEWLPTISRATYNAAIGRIKDEIANGKTYQVNFTFRLSNNFSGNPWSLFVDMINAQVSGFSAFIETRDYVICSASPELFFRLDGDLITCRPMKGTVKRGRTLLEDKLQAAWLRSSIKNRAENVMIVDMVRNDLGRLAKIGSILVPELFITERYPSLWQMTSGITANTNAPFSEIVSVLFPSASITGAPKVSTMKIIAALETTPRRVYTGSIGYLAPGRKAQFNVAIRSVLIDKESGQAEYGIGGGIVWDSTSKNEYAEAILKSRVLTQRHPTFSLLETMRWTAGEGFFLLEDHLQRLSDSAEYFGFPYDREKVVSFLKSLHPNLSGPAARLRLLLDKQGLLSQQNYTLDIEPPNLPLRVRIAHDPVNSNNIFLFHKTTNRDVYENARLHQSDCDDVLLFNEHDELTETSISNLIFELNGKLVTPPTRCGLLSGTFRSHLLKQGKIRERIVKLADLPNCTQIFLINSVRGWQKAELV